MKAMVVNANGWPWSDGSSRFIPIRFVNGGGVEAIFVVVDVVVVKVVVVVAVLVVVTAVAEQQTQPTITLRT